MEYTQHIDRRWACRWPLPILALLTLCPVVQAQPENTLVGLPWSAYVFADARAVKADPAGRLYVADAAGVVVVLGPDGTPLRLISGGDQTALVEPVDVDPTNGLILLVADAAAGRIYRFGEDGLVLESLGGEHAPRLSTFGTPLDPDTFAPVAAASNARNEVFAVDRGTRRLYRWDVSRQRTVLSGPDDGVLADPRALTVTEDRIFVLDDTEVVAFDRFGTPVRRFARVHAAQARRIRVLGDRLALVLPNGVALYNLEGGLERVMAWNGPPLRDAVLTDAALFLLAPHALFRVER